MKIIITHLVLSISFFLYACQSNSTPQAQQEDYKNGEINISVDESYKPIFDELIQVHHSSFPNAKINVYYKTEAQCIKDFTNDSFRLVITSKRIQKQEEEIITQNQGFKPAYGILAYDAIAVITNKKNRDSIFSIEEIKNILTQKNKKYVAVLDGLTQSSILRYINENMINTKTDSLSIKGTANSIELLNHIASHPNSIGFIGVSWVGNKEDSLQLSFMNNIRIASIECLNCEKKDIFVKPYQANLITNKYPFLREIHYLLKENFMGVGRGFVNFMSNERGQLIFKRAYLVPGKMNFNVRKVKLS